MIRKKKSALSMQMEIGAKGAIGSQLSGLCFLIPILPPLRASAPFLRADLALGLSSHRYDLSGLSAAPPGLALSA